MRDWGSIGYEGDVIDVVEDTQRLDFQEALQWIVEEVGSGPDTLRSDDYANARSNGSSKSSSGGPSEPRGDGRAEGDSEMGVVQNRREVAPGPVISHERAQRWSGRLMAEGKAPEAARRYLLGERGLHEGF